MWQSVERRNRVRGESARLQGFLHPLTVACPVLARVSFSRMSPNCFSSFVLIPTTAHHVVPDAELGHQVCLDVADDLLTPAAVEPKLILCFQTPTHWTSVHLLHHPGLRLWASSARGRAELAWTVLATARSSQELSHPKGRSEGTLARGRWSRTIIRERASSNSGVRQNHKKQSIRGNRSDSLGYFGSRRQCTNGQVESSGLPGLPGRLRRWLSAIQPRNNDARKSPCKI